MMSLISKFIKGRCLLVIAIATTVVSIFAYTLLERDPWFGKMNSGLWLMGSSVKFARNWYRDGAINDGLVMLDRPRSIETSELKSRSIYLSYPSGSVIPIHLLARLTGKEPNPKMVMGYNLFIQLIVSLAFALAVYLAASHIGIGAVQTYFLALISASFYLLAPNSLAFHLNRYFADSAIMLPFALVIFLEVLLCTRNMSKKKRYFFTAVQHLFLALGLFTDYLFVFVFGLLYLKKAVLGELGTKIRDFLINSALFSISALVPILFFIYQIVHFDAIKTIKYKFLYRTANNDAGQKYVKDFYEQFWKTHIVKHLQSEAIMIVAATVVCLLGALITVSALRVIRKRRVSNTALSLLGLCFVIVFSCLFQLYFLKNHSVIHDFSALKVTFFIAIVSFGLLSISIAGLSPKIKNIFFGDEFEFHLIYWKKKPVRIPVFMLLFTLLYFSYMTDIYPKFKSLTDRNPKRIEEIGYFVGNNTKFDDVVFSDTVSIKDNPPQLLALSMKLVYWVQDKDKMEARIEHLPDNSTVNFLIDKRKSKLKIPFGGKEIWGDAERIEEGNLILYKTKKINFTKKLISAR